MDVEFATRDAGSAYAVPFARSIDDAKTVAMKMICQSDRERAVVLARAASE
jgi:hypothetical protein